MPHLPSSANPSPGPLFCGLPVLMYHHISPVSGPCNVHPENFRAQMTWLRDEGYRCLGARELLAYRQGNLPLPGKSVVLSFDDGWLDNWTCAAPILRSVGFRGVLFVVTGWPGEGPARPMGDSPEHPSLDHYQCMDLVSQNSSRDSVLMRWSELKEAEAQGVFDLECHSHSHGLWWYQNHRQAIQESFEEDLQQSLQSFRHHLGRAPRQFCWPKGQFTPAMARLVKSAGFALQHSTLRGSNPGGCDNRLVRRLNVEDRPLSWFKRRVRFYSSPFLSALPALAHQHLLVRRLRGQFGDRLNNADLTVPQFRLL